MPSSHRPHSSVAEQVGITVIARKKVHHGGSLGISVRVLERNYSRIWVCVSLFGGVFKGLGLCYVLDAVRKWDNPMNGHLDKSYL